MNHNKKLSFCQKPAREFLLLLSLCLFLFTGLTVKAAAANGIAGNGTGGIYIDINAAPYTNYANIPTWGQYAYGPSGCAWFASARVNQLTGANCTIYSGKSWYNSAYKNFGFSRGRSIQAKALACYENHVAVVESVNGSSAVVSEGGYSASNCNASTGYCIIHTLSISKLESGRNGAFIGYVYLGGGTAPNPADTQPPSLSNLRVSDITADGYTVSCTVTDNVGVTRVRFPSWNADIHRGEQAEWIEGTLNGNTASARVNIAGLKSGAREGNYMTHIYAHDAAGNTASLSINNGQPLFIDRTRPLISDVYAEKMGKEGYWVYCKVTDNLENNIDRVQFPTWTLYNDQDDLVIDWKNSSAVRGEKYGDCNYRFFVNINEHNQELGFYRTHIYAVDKYGNWGDYGGLQDIELTKDDAPSKPDNPDTPDNPDNPDKPDNPDNPNNPDNPDSPDNPKPPVTPKYYTVQFQKNGGTKLSRSKVTVQASQKIGTLPKAQRKGYTLKGWYTAKSGGSKISASTRISKSQTFYAQWSKVKKPGRVTSLSAKKVKKGKMKITYRKVSGAAGYEIAYSSNSRFSKYATYKINVKSAGKTLSGLWKNQTYYVRVRAYKLDSMGNKIYGSYSAKKKVKV